MAEAAVSFALGKVQLLKEEGTLLGGIHNDFADIKDELESIGAFLKEADTRAADEGSSKDGIKAWVKQLREVSFRIEDVIAKYNVYMVRGTDHLGFMAFLQKFFHSIKTLKTRHQVASEIKEIKLSIHGIKERSERYKFQSSLENGSSSSNSKENRSGRWHDPRMASPFIEEAEVVGFENPRDQLVGWLVLWFQ